MQNMLRTDILDLVNTFQLNPIANRVNTKDGPAEPRSGDLDRTLLSRLPTPLSLPLLPL